MRACLRTLAASASVTVYWGSNEQNAPFTPVAGEPYTEVSFGDRPRVRDLEHFMDESRPELVLHCGWHFRAYRRVARRYPGVKHLLFFDNPWRGSSRQVAFSLVMRRFVV